MKAFEQKSQELARVAVRLLTTVCLHVTLENGLAAFAAYNNGDIQVTMLRHNTKQAVSFTCVRMLSVSALLISHLMH